MKVNVKNEKGITLFVLIITIIVMLILASVSVRISTGSNGSNGVIQRTTTQRKQQQNSVTEEGEKMENMIKNEATEDWGY